MDEILNLIILYCLTTAINFFKTGLSQNFIEIDMLLI